MSLEDKSASTIDAQVMQRLRAPFGCEFIPPAKFSLSSHAGHWRIYDANDDAIAHVSGLEEGYARLIVEALNLQAEHRKTKQELDGLLAANDRSFDEVWAEKEQQGYRYGQDALEQVRFGWGIAQEIVLRAIGALRWQRNRILPDLGRDGKDFEAKKAAYIQAEKSAQKLLGCYDEKMADAAWQKWVGR